MLTPQDITNQAFQKAVFGGYDMASVDDFLDQLTEDYTALYKENAILKNKMKVLVEKVEEYRNSEDSMRMAIVSAQKMSKDLTEDAEAKAKAILDNAEDDARKKAEELKLGTAEEEERLEQAKAKTAAFIADVSEKFLAHIRLLESIGVEPVETAKQPVDPVAATAKSIEDSFERMFSKPFANDLSDTKPVTIDSEDGRFKNLSFGSNKDK
jgi:cell division initiation protein